MEDIFDNHAFCSYTISVQLSRCTCACCKSELGIDGVPYISVWVRAAYRWNNYCNGCWRYLFSVVKCKENILEEFSVIRGDIDNNRTLGRIGNLLNGRI